MANNLAQEEPQTSLDEERRLVDAAKRGDLNALRPLFEQYADPLYSAIIMPRLGDPSMAEEILRDTLSTAVEKLDRFEWQGKGIFGWLRQIAINKVFDHHRRTKRSRRLADALAKEVATETMPEDLPTARMIEDEEQRSNRARIAEAMGKLNERYRRVIELRLLEERSREECAAELGINVGNFDVVLFRAVRSFRKHFGERDADAKLAFAESTDEP